MTMRNLFIALTVAALMTSGASPSPADPRPAAAGQKPVLTAAELQVQREHQEAWASYIRQWGEAHGGASASSPVDVDAINASAAEWTRRGAALAQKRVFTAAEWARYIQQPKRRAPAPATAQAVPPAAPSGGRRFQLDRYDEVIEDRATRMFGAADTREKLQWMADQEQRAIENDINRTNALAYPVGH